jgi:hypothetical protein
VLQKRLRNDLGQTGRHWSRIGKSWRATNEELMIARPRQALLRGV